MEKQDEKTQGGEWVSVDNSKSNWRRGEQKNKQIKYRHSFKKWTENSGAK